MLCCCSTNDQAEVVEVDRVVKQVPGLATGTFPDGSSPQGGQLPQLKERPPPLDTSVPAPPREQGIVDGGRQFYVKLEKTPDNLRIGLDTVARRQPPALKIKRLKDGLVSSWNAANPDKIVKIEDLILEVNGECSDVEKMYDAIAKNSTLDLLIRSS
mmetsp:Transcript_10366/g.22852  ORF Transcript_10366/g.22852 Transcript_10366/m.22852 type:complete len:157 (+) Transcript_10366:97-567(+)